MILKSNFLNKFIKNDTINREEEIKKKFELDIHLYEKNKFLEESDIRNKILKDKLFPFIDEVMGNMKHNKLLFQSNAALEVRNKNKFLMLNVSKKSKLRSQSTISNRPETINKVLNNNFSIVKNKTSTSQVTDKVHIKISDNINSCSQEDKTSSNIVSNSSNNIRKSNNYNKIINYKNKEQQPLSTDKVTKKSVYKRQESIHSKKSISSEYNLNTKEKLTNEANKFKTKKTAEDIFKRNKIKEIVNSLNKDIIQYKKNNEDYNNDLIDKVKEDRRYFKLKKIEEEKQLKEIERLNEKEKSNHFGELIPKILERPEYFNDPRLMPNKAFSRLYQNCIVNLNNLNSNDNKLVKEENSNKNEINSASIKFRNSNQTITSLYEKEISPNASPSNRVNSPRKIRNAILRNTNKSSNGFNKSKETMEDSAVLKENSILNSIYNKKLKKYKVVSLFPENNGKEFSSAINDSMYERSLRASSTGPDPELSLQNKRKNISAFNENIDGNREEEAIKKLSNLKERTKLEMNRYNCYDFRFYNDEDNNNFLHISSSHGKIKIVEELCKCGFNPNKKNNNGDTPCHLAAERGFIDVLKVLVRYGGSLYLKNDKGKSATEFLKESTVYYIMNSIKH